MKEIEAKMIFIQGIGKNLQDLRAEAGVEEEKGSYDSSTTPKPYAKKDHKTEYIPFLKIQEIADGSPSQECGLKKNDQIAKFGDIDFKYEDPLKAIAEKVSGYQDQTIKLIVLREGESDALELDLVPKTWSGKGLLGCYLVKC